MALVLPTVPHYDENRNQNRGSLGLGPGIIVAPYLLEFQPARLGHR